MASNRFSQLPIRRALSIFCTAGFPRRDDIVPVVERLQAAGVDMVEIGFPFSDPTADGPTIQVSNLQAISNGMNVELLFRQLEHLREKVSIPVVLMGYLNPVEQYGAKRFLTDAARCGVDGLILPDMPFEEYCEVYKPIFREAGIRPVFLVTSRTAPDRIEAFDREEPAFLYVVSSDAVTGGKVIVSEDRAEFFKRLFEMKLSSRLIVGFGVTDRETFDSVTERTHGAIIASAFLKAIATAPAITGNAHATDFAGSGVVEEFIGQIR